MSNREDAEFSAATKVKIAAAVNHQCSAPLCKNPAHGTGDGSTINGGTACHIYSAAENGPRGRGGLTPKELADVDNGLWCCAYHGRIIDANQGASFPAVQLQMWKRLAEGRVRRAMSVEYAELGWIHEFNLEVETHAGQHWRVSRNLQKNNIISESSGVGKSLLLEALASISQGDHARRLCCFPAYTVQVQYETLTRESRAETSARAGGPIHRKIGGKECAIAPPDIAILYLNPNDNEYIGDRFGVKRLTRLLNVDESTLHALARAVTRDSGSAITVTFAQPDQDDKQDAPDESGAPRWVPMIAMKGQSNALPWSSLSSGERTKIALEFLVALAREEAKSRPVLLCIDALWNLDDKGFRRVLSMLEEEHLQLIVVAPREIGAERISKDFSSWNRLGIPSIESALKGRDPLEL